MKDSTNSHRMGFLRAAGNQRLGLMLLLVACGLWIAFGTFGRRPQEPGASPLTESQGSEQAVGPDAATPSAPLAGPEMPVQAEPKLRSALRLSADPQPLAAERDLLVRVLDAAGELQNGVCVALMLQAPDSTWMPVAKDLRVSGSLDQALASDGEQEWDPMGRGQARWDSELGSLRQYWRAFDAGKASDLPRLGVGILAPHWGAGEHAAPLVHELKLSDWPTRGVDLELQPGVAKLYEPLRVEVLHADGQPAVDVPVGLFGIPTSSQLGHGSFFGQARSDSEGVARVPLHGIGRLSAFLGGAEGAELNLKSMFSFWVAPAYPSLRLQKVAIPGGLGSGQTVRLELPPVARVRASFWSLEGEPYPLEDTAMQLRVNWDRGGAPREEFYGRSIRDFVHTPALDLGWVGLGVAAQASAWPEDGDVPGARAELPAIEAAGELELRFEFGERNLRLAWSLFGSGGELLADTELAYCLRDQDLELRPKHPQQRHWRKATTDSEGRFLWVMGQPLPDPKAMDFLLGGEDAHAWGSVALPQVLPARPELEAPGALPVVPMGEVHLSAKELPPLPQPLEALELPLAEGRVLGESGQPLKGVAVTAYSVVPGRSRQMASKRTDADGVFRLHSVDPEPCSLVLNLKPYVLRSTSREPALQPGVTGLEYRLQPGLELTLQLDRFNAPFGDYLRVEAAQGRSQYDARQEPGGVFRFSRLPAGSYSVSIRAEGLRAPLASFDDVRVSAKALESDARLAGIDFRALAYARWYTFEDSLGQPLSAHEVSLRVEGCPGARGRRDTNGTSRLFLILPRAASAVEFGVEGVGSARVPMGDEDVTVRLSPGR